MTETLGFSDFIFTSHVDNLCKTFEKVFRQIFVHVTRHAWDGAWFFVYAGHLYSFNGYKFLVFLTIAK